MNLPSRSPQSCRKREIALSTDLYELTMANSYALLRMDGRATFSLVTRKLPKHRSFLVVAGLEEALDRVANFQFDRSSIDYLRQTGQVSRELLERLEDLRFTGDIWAVPEGRAVFAGEPLVEVDAPLIEAQLIETMLLNAIHYPTAVATKAARCVAAAPGKELVEFGLRREPGIEAGLAAARSAYLTGFSATSNLLAGERYSIPIAGTLAHSFIEAFDSESEALEAFARTFPGPSTLLVDTYDTIAGAKRAIEVARRVRFSGKVVTALRLDSGDLMSLSTRIRRLLDASGFRDVRIFASGGFDEYELDRLVTGGAPIDAYGVGTRLGMSADAPVLDLAYKLAEYDGVPRLKLSSQKETLAGAKQVWRRLDHDGHFAGDVISARDEAGPGAGWESLLEPVMRHGVAGPMPSLGEIRERHELEISRLSGSLRRIRRPGRYRVELSESLTALQAATVEAIADR